MNLQKRGVVIAIGNQKGGVGKTTTTTNLAAALGQLGRKCLILDLDGNKGAAHSFLIQAESYAGTYELFITDEDPRTLIINEEDEEVNLPTNVHIIPGTRKLEEVHTLLEQREKFGDAKTKLRRPLEVLRPLYDYIFLDTAPNGYSPTINAYTCADYFLLTAIPEPLAIQGIDEALRDIAAVRQMRNPGLKLLGVVLTRVDRRTSLSAELKDYVARTFRESATGIKPFETVIHATTEIPKAQKDGKTIFQTNPDHKAALEYMNLAREIEERAVPKVTTDQTSMALKEVANG
jgi:chromosome partitioning protein